MIKGTLIPIGGNENKGEETDENISFEFIKKGILSHVVRESGGPDSKIIVIPTASSVPEEVAKNYLDAFGILGCTDIEILDIRSREDSESSRAVDLIKAADCVMFSGGDQSKITKKIEGTTIHQIMMERYQNDESFVIAGTSAGAMAMSSHMIAGGSSTEAFIKGAVIMYHGLGLMPEIMIDTHFIMRGRFGRICEAVAKYPTLVGFGLAEDTGLVIKNGNDMKVIGSGMVIVFDGRSLVHNNENILAPGTPMTITDLKVHVLSNSDHYSLAERKVTVLPIDAPFEFD